LGIFFVVGFGTGVAWMMPKRPSWKQVRDLVETQQHRWRLEATYRGGYIEGLRDCLLRRGFNQRPSACLADSEWDEAHFPESEFGERWRAGYLRGHEDGETQSQNTWFGPWSINTHDSGG